MTTVKTALTQKQIEYKENCSLSSYTSFKIGGAADLLITPKTADELKAAILLCKEQNMPYMLLGKGSNLLISDKGIAGAVIHITTPFKKMEIKDECDIVCGAGASLTALCAFARDNSLTGLEFAYGIPGSVGGAVYMNAGAYGGEMKDVIKSVTFMTETGEIKTLAKDELDFSYRHSIFSGTKNIILSAEFSLQAGDKEKIDTCMVETMKRRIDKQPLNFPSAGSVFKRPEGYFAGTLIEDCGLKGYTIGGAQVSKKHAGFIINIGGATCDDVLKLVEHIRNTVKEKHGVLLEPEIIKIGR